MNEQKLPTETIAASKPKLPLPPSGSYQELPVNRVRKIIAERLTAAKQEIPHFYLTVDCILEKLLKVRNAHNKAKSSNEKLSVNDYIIKACALALRETPQMNVSWSGQHLLQFNDVDVSVAVSTPNGLITPVIREADSKSLGEVSEEVKGLVVRARSGRLSPQEYKGGSFTVSNLGMFGVREFAAIINPPQSAILAVGAAEQRVIVESASLSIVTMLTLTLSVDHRAVDGAVAAQFLQVLVDKLESPEKLLEEYRAHL